MTMCRVLCVARAGFYAWLHNPVSARDKDNQRLLTLIRDSYSLSGGVYGYRRVHGDLNEIGEICGKNRVGRIMQLNRIKAVRGYKAPRRIAGRPSVVAPNRVQRQFTVVRANQVWVTDITYIRTWQGWLYLAVVIDLFARNVVGWSMKPTLSRELALDALMMAVWRRKPDGEVIVHSDQGSQYGSDDWQRFCRANNLAPSMSRRGNCWDNAVAESFFSSLKKERIRKRIYKTRDLDRADKGTISATGVKPADVNSSSIHHLSVASPETSHRLTAGTNNGPQSLFRGPFIIRSLSSASLHHRSPLHYDRTVWCSSLPPCPASHQAGFPLSALLPICRMPLHYCHGS